MDVLPSRSTVLFYGALSEEGPSEIDPLLMIGRSITLQAFILGTYLQSKGLGILWTLGKCNSLMQDTTLQSKIQRKFPISKVHEAIKDYYKNMTGGKFVLCPHMDDAELTDGAVFEPFSINDLRA